MRPGRGSPTAPARRSGSPAKYHDPETGLHYNNQRYYDPDPLGLAPALNPHTDPLGLKKYTTSYSESYVNAAGKEKGIVAEVDKDGIFNSFNAALRDGHSLEDAALLHTFTGKMASRLGFGNSVDFESLRLEITATSPKRLWCSDE